MCQLSKVLPRLKPSCPEHRQGVSKKSKSLHESMLTSSLIKFQNVQDKRVARRNSKLNGFLILTKLRGT